MNRVKKLAGLIALCGLFLLLLACQNGSEQEPGDKNGTDRETEGGQGERQAFDNGVVTEKDEPGRRLLITQMVDSGGKPAVRAVWFAISEGTELTDNRKNALYFHDIEVGDRVEAWHIAPIGESFPEQGVASKIVRLAETEAPSGWVSSRQAVKAALASVSSSDKVWTVLDAVPDREGEQWKVTLAAAGDAENPHRVSVDGTSGNAIFLQNDAFRVFQPVPSEAVGSSFTVRGKARVMEGAFGWELEDGHYILAEGQGTAAAGAPQWGNFEFEVRFEAATNPSLSLILFANSPKDGSREHELVLPLKPEEDLIRYGPLSCLFNSSWAAAAWRAGTAGSSPWPPFALRAPVGLHRRPDGIAVSSAVGGYSGFIPPVRAYGRRSLPGCDLRRPAWPGCWSHGTLRS